MDDVDNEFAATRHFKRLIDKYYKMSLNKLPHLLW